MKLNLYLDSSTVPVREMGLAGKKSSKGGFGATLILQKLLPTAAEYCSKRPPEAAAVFGALL